MRDPSGPKRPLLVIVNPTAGRGRGRARGDALATELRRAGTTFELARTTRPGDATRLAAMAAGTVVAVGGDGTVHEVLNGLPTRDDRLGPLAVLPSGSGDDFANGAGFDDRPGELARRLAADDAHEHPCDFGEATVTTANGTITRRFANEASIGFVADVARAARGLPLRGRSLYIGATIRAVLRQRAISATVTRDDDDAPTGELLFASFCNGPRVGGGLPFTPAARLDDGLLDLLTVDATSRLGTLRLLQKLVSCRHLGDQRVRAATLRTGAVRCERGAPVAMDGDLVTDAATRIAVRSRSLLRLVGCARGRPDRCGAS